jgi:hypothetical protein
MSNVVLSGIRIFEFVVPPLANTEQALEWGRGLTNRQRKLLLAAHKSMELAALNARHLQDRADFATIAQLWREAAEAR